MKLPTFFLLFLTNICIAQEYKWFEQDLALKGNISSVGIFLLTTDEKQIPMEFRSFEKTGRELLSKTYYNGRINTHIRHQYSKNQIATELCDYCEDLDKTFAQFSIKENQKYPYMGYVTDDPKRTLKMIKTTDARGNVLFSKTYTVDGYFTGEQRTTYDKNDKVLLEELYDDEGIKQKNYKKYTYNPDGFLKEEIVFENSYERKNIFEYDELGRKVLIKEFQGEYMTERSFEYKTEKDTAKVLMYLKHANDTLPSLYKTEMTFRKGDKKILKSTNITQGIPNFISITEYDTQDNVISRKNYNSQNEFITDISIEYDSKGNWISMHVAQLVKVSHNRGPLTPEWQTKKYIRVIEYLL
ncbi:MAG: hypothetical protein ACK4RM_03740 [Flavobacterium sp.]